MTPRELVRAYAEDLQALAVLFEKEKHDDDAYRNFGPAMDVAMANARRAAEVYVAAETKAAAPKDLAKILAGRRARVAAIFRAGFRAGREAQASGNEAEDDLVDEYARTKVPEPKVPAIFGGQDTVAPKNGAPR